MVFLNRGQFNLKIDDVLLRRADNSPEFAVLFSGNFPSDIQGESLRRAIALFEPTPQQLAVRFRNISRDNLPEVFRRCIK